MPIAVVVPQVEVEIVIAITARLCQCSVVLEEMRIVVPTTAKWKPNLDSVLVQQELEMSSVPIQRVRNSELQ